MALRDDLLAGLKAADAAGNTADAQHFASQIKALPEALTNYSRQVLAAKSNPGGSQLAADRILEATQGLGLGFGDEASGVVGGLDSLIRGKNSKSGQDTFSGGYDATVGRARQDLKDYEGARPLEALGINALGSLPDAAIAAPRALGQMVPLGTKMLQAAKTGAKIGAVAGAGYSDGDLPQRAGGAVTGALTGGLLSAAVPIIPAVVRGVRSAIRSVTQPAQTFAQEALANALTKDSVATLDPTKPVIDQVPVKGRTTQLAEQGALEGEGRTQADDYYDKKSQARESTVLSTVKNVVSDAPMYDMMDDLQAQRTADAAPLYQTAHTTSYRRTPRLMDLLSRSATGGALRAAYTRLQNDPNLDPADIQEALGPIMGKNPDDLSDAQLAQRMTQAMGSRPLEFKALDYVKRGMDQLVLDNPGAARETRQLRNAYSSELKNINPNYQAALNAWAGPSAVLDAIDQGREFDGMDPEAIQRALSDMSDSEQQGFQVGVSRRLQDLASGAKSRQPGQNASLNLAKAVDGNSVMQRRLQASLGTNGQSPTQLLKRNGWQPTAGGSDTFASSTKPGVQITVNGDGTWSAGQTSKSGKSTSLMNSGPDQSTLESFLTGNAPVVKPGASSVDDLLNMSKNMVNDAAKQNIIVGNSATARRAAGADTFGGAADFASAALGGPKGLAWWALKSKLAGSYLQGLTSARRAAVSKLLYSNDPADNQAAIDAIEKIRAGKTPTALQSQIQQKAPLIPAMIGVEAGQGANN